RLWPLLLVAPAVVFSIACFAVVVGADAHPGAGNSGVSVVFLLAALGGLWWPFFHQRAWMQTVGRWPDDHVVDVRGPRRDAARPEPGRGVGQDRISPCLRDGVLCHRIELVQLRPGTL